MLIKILGPLMVKHAKLSVCEVIEDDRFFQKALTDELKLFKIFYQT